MIRENATVMTALSYFHTRKNTLEAQTVLFGKSIITDSFEELSGLPACLPI